MLLWHGTTNCRPFTTNIPPARAFKVSFYEFTEIDVWQNGRTEEESFLNRCDWADQVNTCVNAKKNQKVRYFFEFGIGY